jgi:hypothetical protein
MTADCLICVQMKDCEAPEDLDECCDDCRAEVLFLTNERRAGRY